MKNQLRHCACASNLVGMASLVLEILLLFFKIGKIFHEGQKIKSAQIFMQVHVEADEICIWTMDINS